MARKRKVKPLLENFEITGFAAEGNSLGKLETTAGQMVVFAPYGAPGDIVNLQVDKKKHNYMEGHIVDILKPSPLRVKPVCEHFGVCGGCKWQHIPYSEQLAFKQRHVTDALTRIAKIELPEIQPIKGSPQQWEYRNKMEYTFSNKKWLTFEELASGKDFPERDCAGFHIPGAFDKVLDINKCHLQNDLGNEIRLFIKNYAKQNGLSFYDLKNNSGLLRTLMIRIVSTGEVMVVMSFGEDDSKAINSLMSAIKEHFPQITSLQYVINTKVNDTITDLAIQLFSGKEYITEKMEGLTFRIGPKSFYQTNSEGAYNLYCVVRDFARLTGSELVYDLYTGTGTIANFLSPKAKKVVGIEYVAEAIEDAKINSQENGISNTVFYAGDMKDVLNEEFIEMNGHPDVIVVDPPRAGMHTDVINVLLKTRAPRLVYVSCNPATQARDLALLSEAYKVTRVQPVDMFPHTHHVENVVLLELNGEAHS